MDYLKHYTLNCKPYSIWGTGGVPLFMETAKSFLQEKSLRPELGLTDEILRHSASPSY